MARWLASGNAELEGGIIEKLGNLKSAVEKETDVVILFGAGLAGAAIRDLMAWASHAAGSNSLHGAGRLHQFARRRRYGRFSGPTAGLCAAWRCRRAQAVWETLGRRDFRGGGNDTRGK